MAHILEAFLPMRAIRPMCSPHRRIRAKCGDGVDLMVGLFEPEPQKAQDVVLFFHGAGAHMAAGYLDFGLDLFETSGAAVMLPDLRGHGRSGGARGRLNAASTLWCDVDELVHLALERYPNARLHLGGHSLGAGLSLNWMSHSSVARALARQGRLQSLMLLAPYTGLARADRTGDTGGAPFITLPSFPGGDVQFDYSTEIATRAKLVRSVQIMMFEAMAPDDFLDQLSRVLSELTLTVSVLLFRDDELFDAQVLEQLLSPLAEQASGRLRVECLPGAHLSGLLTVGKAVGKTLADAYV